MMLFAIIVILGLSVATPASADPVTAFLVTAFQSLGFGAVVATALAGYAVNALINVAVGLLTNALFGGGAVAQGVTTMVREPTASHKLIYGTRRASGPILYIESTGQDGKYLHLVIVLAAHECSDITDVYFNEKLVWSGGTYQDDWADFARIKTHLGADSQVADTDLVAESNSHWTADHKVADHAYLYVRLLYDQDQYTNGLPNISAIVEGRKLYDPRDLSTTFSANPALCIRDYMFDTKHGMAIEAEEWNETACISLANLSDENVTTLDAGTQARFECNAVVDTAGNHGAVLEAMLITTLGGLTYSGGQFSIFGSEYRTPTITLTEADLAGPVKIQTAVTKRQNYNGVKGRFSPALNNYTDDEYPAVLSATYETADGSPQYLSVDFPFETNSERAQRNAKLLLNKSRQKITFTAEFKMTAFELIPSDNVMLTLSRYGFSAKIFEVLTVDLNVHKVGPTVTLALRETASGVYDWTASDADPYLAGPPTSLPNPLSVTAPTFTTSDELRQQGASVVIALIVDLSAYSSVFVSTFIVEGKLSTDTEWTTFGSGLQSKFEWLGVQDGAVYDVRARVVTLLGARSAYHQTQHTINSFANPPADVSNFNINVMIGQANFTWDSDNDLSLSHYVMRYSPLLSGAAYNSSEIVAVEISTPATSISLPYRAGTYFIRAVDQIGNEGVSPTSIVTNVGVVEGLNAIETVTESTGYLGTHIGTSQNWDGFLLLENGDYLLAEDGGKIPLEQATGSGLIIHDVSGAAPYGEYIFGSLVDLGAKYTSRVEAKIQFIRSDESGELFDDASGLFDDRPGLFDGGEFSDVNAKLQVSLTDDNPADVEAGITPDATYYTGDVFSVAYADRIADFFLAIDVTFPASPAGGLISVGNTAWGMCIDFDSGDLLLRCGDGNAMPDVDTAIIRYPWASLAGKRGTLYCGQVFSTATISMWWIEDGDITLLGSNSASSNYSKWANANAGTWGRNIQNVGGYGNEITNCIIHEARWYASETPPEFPTWGDWIDFFTGDFSARGLKFKAVLESTSTGVSPLITSLSASVDMPDRVIAEDDLVSGAGAYSVTFSPALKGLTGFGISEIAGMTTGDTYAISAKTADGFTIHFKDSGGTSVSRIFGYVARGYGKVV